MPTWGAILHELATTQAALQSQGINPGIAFDSVRRKYLAHLAKLTGRNVILYASNWTGGVGQDPTASSMTPEDQQGFMEVVHGLTSGTPLDLIVHLPGGRAEATEHLVNYLRAKFGEIRVFVPHAAMSAATMLACASDRVVMGRHSALGPIDPQFPIRMANGQVMMTAAHAILEQWAMAQAECRDPTKVASWLPILSQYGPALIVQCKLAQELSQDLVERWLARYMLAGQANAAQLAKSIASQLADHGTFKTHGRFIPRDQVRALGLVVDDLEADQALQDAVLSVFHATMHTFNATPTAKIIENHNGKCWAKAAQVVLQPAQPAQPAPLPPALPNQATPKRKARTSNKPRRATSARSSKTQIRKAK